MPTPPIGVSFLRVIVAESPQATARRERPPHAQIVRFLGQPVEHLVVPDDRDQPGVGAPPAPRGGGRLDHPPAAPP
ncbi:hypothetical protein, partial [Nocardia abscessus]|uniref:hypothetical protein n=1 Tax=Nocardia abscessus TaxID=120957 RepID=UPI003CC7CED8